MQILLVDDSAVYRKLIGDHLRSWEFDFTVAETGEKAWQVLELPHAPNLVLLDWVLPDLEGIELCQRIRKVGTTGHTFTSSCSPANKAGQNMLDAMKAGADDYLGQAL